MDSDDQMGIIKDLAPGPFMLVSSDQARGSDRLAVLFERLVKGIVL